MKIIITESKLYQAVIDYLNERYDINNIHWAYGLDDWGNEVDYAMSFYEGDFEDDNDLFISCKLKPAARLFQCVPPRGNKGIG